MKTVGCMPARMCVCGWIPVPCHILTPPPSLSLWYDYPPTHPDNWVSSTPALVPLSGSDKAVLVVGSRDGSVYGLDPTNGHQLWTFATRFSVYSSPTPGTLFPCACVCARLGKSLCLFPYT